MKKRLAPRHYDLEVKGTPIGIVTIKDGVGYKAGDIVKLRSSDPGLKPIIAKVTGVYRRPKKTRP